jgi:type IX secretion system substrate protein
MVADRLHHLFTPRFTHIAWFFAVSYFLFVGYDSLHSTGYVGATKKNGDGCTCHGDHAPTDTVLVWIEGPDSVSRNQLAFYTVFIKGGPAVGGGFNVAANTGTLLPFDGSSQVIAGELTHVTPKGFGTDTVSWKFFYQAPSAGTVDTIFSVGNSVDLNGIPTNDQYNFGANFVVHLKDTTTGVEEASQPSSFRLEQNYPNPFNPVTGIRYAVPTSRFVTLSVFDVRGRVMTTLVQGVLPAGEYRTEFDGSDLPSGIYYYRLTQGGSSVTKKMLLIR